jgi:uncharacterized membrane protein
MGCGGSEVKSWLIQRNIEKLSLVFANDDCDLCN